MQDVAAAGLRAEDGGLGRALGARRWWLGVAGTGVRRARSLLHTARCPAQRPRSAPAPRRARASLLLPRRAPRLSFYGFLPAPIPLRRGARARQASHSSGGAAIPRAPRPAPRSPAGRLRPCPAPRRHWPSPACPCPDARWTQGWGSRTLRAPGGPMNRQSEHWGRNEENVWKETMGGDVPKRKGWGRAADARFRQRAPGRRGGGRSRWRSGRGEPGLEEPRTLGGRQGYPENALSAWGCSQGGSRSWNSY